MTDARDLSVGVFVRGLTNLKAQLTKAQEHVVASGCDEAALLDARLAHDGLGPGAPADVHRFTLAAQVHWAAEGAKLAVAQLLGTPLTPSANDATSFSDLHQRIDATLVYLRGVAQGDLEDGLNRPLALELRHGKVSSSGVQFLLGYAIPHFYYHLASSYGILRNQGVPLTMGDFLGNWSIDEN